VRPSNASLLIFLGLLALGGGPAASRASAQYFGRNQVRYQSFDFRILKTEHFDLYYYPDEAKGAALAARMAERWYGRLSRLLGADLSRRQPIILYASQPHFQQTTTVGGIGEGTGGVTEPFKRRVVLPMAGPLAETDHVLGHELVHAFQYDMTARTGSTFAPPTALIMPLWFIEGMAEYLSIGPDDPHTAMWMRDAARTKHLPTTRQLNDPRFFPYRYGQALWAYIGGRWGDQIIGEILRRSAQNGAVIPTMAAALGRSPDSLIANWKQATEQAYAALADSTRAPGDYGRSLIAPGPGRGRLLLAPALSPDGKSLVFLSQQGAPSIEMFLADAQTGEIKRKIVKTALDPHYESLEFINSAGAWHPDGRRFAFAGISKGRPVVSVLDVERGKIEREFTIPEADEVFSPSWSPDGAHIVFSGLTGGLLDLFVLDVPGGVVKHLTDDAFADLQPTWSPDGKRIAFVTDRFTTDLATLSHGAYRLALVDPESGEIRPLRGFESGKHINPQWAPDGASLYFLSDRSGITNIYRLNVATAEVTQVTDVLTGVSGLTSLSPALSVAQRSQGLVFSAYQDGKYEVYAVDSATVLAGTPPRSLAVASPALLPPLDRARGKVDSLLADPLFSLPPDSAIATEKYRPRLSVDFVNPVSVGVGSGGAFGNSVGVGGGSAVFWSDMLGQRYLTSALQVFGGFADIAAVAAYRNVRSRWTWGFTAGQSPFISLGFRRTGSLSSDSVVVDSLRRFRQTDRELSGVLAYPFSRVERIEFTAGYRWSSFSNEVATRRIITKPLPWRVTVNDPVDLPAPGAIAQVEGGVALVHDNALFGATSPVLGQRYRLAVSPSVGALTYYGVLADYRRYIVPVRPYTLAGRLLHYGRYGKDSDDGRLVPLFLGYQPLVRGYSATSFDLTSCSSIIRKPSDCPVPVFEDLLGSRILVANLEFRAPLFEGLGVDAPAGLPRVELAPFFDAGVAWVRGDEPSFLGGDRNLVTSYGLAVRVNLFGAAILELDIVHPNDRPGNRWYTQWGFQPGF
jgi:Tol biopolymer transport system component